MGAPSIINLTNLPPGSHNRTHQWQLHMKRNMSYPHPGIWGCSGPGKGISKESRSGNIGSPRTSSDWDCSWCSSWPPFPGLQGASEGISICRDRGGLRLAVCEPGGYWVAPLQEDDPNRTSYSRVSNGFPCFQQVPWINMVIYGETYIFRGFPWFPLHHRR